MFFNTSFVSASGSSINISSNGKYLIYQNGTPFLINGDSPWSLIVQLNNTDVQYYLDNRQSKGFNTILVNLVEHSFSSNPPYNKYNVPSGEQGGVPILFIEKDYVIGDTSIINQIEPLYLKCKDQHCPADTNSISGLTTEKEFSLNSLILLAFADAVNPCELAVLIILMTAILTQFPQNKKKALYAGLAFSSAIFLMYFVFGILIITGFKFLSTYLNVSNTLFFLVLAILAIILGLLNLKDAVVYGGGGFIMEVPQKWRPKMKALIQGTTSVKGAFVVGLIVSLFLTPCTAGPYFVAAGMLATVSWITSIPYFLLYMLIFISPMVTITFITYLGFAKVDDMGGWRERNLKKLHLVAGLIMLIIGLMMLAWTLGIISF
jgi:cytochrome c biogenesis protein CcdA